MQKKSYYPLNNFDMKIKYSTKNLKFLFVGLGVLKLLTSCGGNASSAIPEELDDTAAASTKAFSVSEVLEMVAYENDVTRTLYTKAIVGAGKKQGLKFDENWQDDEVEAGPLPALFLRGISADIRKSPVCLLYTSPSPRDRG